MINETVKTKVPISRSEGSGVKTPKPLKRYQSANRCPAQVLDATQQGSYLSKMNVKAQVLMTKAERTAFVELLDGYAMQAPTWLAVPLRLTRDRRAFMNKIFFESGLDAVWCPFCFVQHSEHWSFKLHRLWHKINV